MEKATESLRWGADVEARDSHGNTLLLIAVEAGDLEMVKLLLKYQADVEVKDPEVSEGQSRVYKSVCANNGPIWTCLIAPRLSSTSSGKWRISRYCGSSPQPRR